MLVIKIYIYADKTHVLSLNTAYALCLTHVLSHSMWHLYKL